MKILLEPHYSKEFGKRVLIPICSEGDRRSNFIKKGDAFECEIKRSRAPHVHAYYFVMMNAYFDNQETFTDSNKFRKAIEMEAGHYDDFVTIHGEVIKQPSSIAYYKLDEFEFRSLFDNVLDVLFEFMGREIYEECERLRKMYNNNFSQIKDSLKGI